MTKTYILIFLYILTTTVFVVLKLTSNIEWSWWLILAPVYVPIVFIFLGAWADIAQDNRGSRQ